MLRKKMRNKKYLFDEYYNNIFAFNIKYFSNKKMYIFSRETLLFFRIKAISFIL